MTSKFKSALQDPTASLFDSAVVKKDQQLVFSPRASKALSHLRKLFEKIENFQDLEPIFSALNTWIGSEHNSTYVPQLCLIRTLNEGEIEQLLSNLLIFSLEILRARSNKNLSRLTFAKELQDKQLPNPASALFLQCFFSEGASILQQHHQILAMQSSNRLKNIEWRLDVVITSQIGRRMLEPNFLIRLHTSYKNIIFEAPVLQFHKLRFAVANLLSELQTLEIRKTISG